MTNKRTKRIRELATKLGVSHRGAANVLDADRRRSAAKVQAAQKAERDDAIVWFRTLLESGRDAPFLDSSFRMGINGIAEGVRIYRSIRELDGLDYLHDHVRLHLGSNQRHQFDAGVMVIETAASAKRRGKEVEFLKPATSGTVESGGRHRSKVADLRLKLARRWITVECTAKQAPNEEQANERVYADLAAWQWTAVCSNGRGCVTIKPAAIPATQFVAELGSVKEAALLLVRAGVLGSVSLAKLCDISFDPDGTPLPSPLENGLVLDTFNRLGESHEATRVIRALEKGAQLPTSEPGVLVVKVPALFWHPDVPRDFRGLAERLLPPLAARPTISAVVVHEVWREASESVAVVDSSTIHQAFITRGPRVRCVLCVPNPVATWHLEPAEVRLLVGPDMIW